MLLTHFTWGKEFQHRCVVQCRSTDEAATALLAVDSGFVQIGRVRPEKNRPVVFLFPGQGAQYVNMGLDLYRHERDFREPFDRCAETLLLNLEVDVESSCMAGQERVRMRQDSNKLRSLSRHCSRSRRRCQASHGLGLQRRQ